MFNLPPKTKNSREQIQQIETKEKQPANLSPLNKVALALGTVAVINISYTPIHSYFNHTDINQAAKADRLYEPYDATPDLDNSYPLSKPCPEATHLSGKALGIALENCGKELNWKQEEIDYENKVNSNMLAMLFLFWLDIGGGSPKPSASQIDSLATRVSKTPKQSTTFRSSTGERVTLRARLGGSTPEAEIKTPNGKTIKTNKDNKEVYTFFDKFQVL